MQVNMNWQKVDELLKTVQVMDLSPILEKDMPRWPTHPPVVIDPTITHEHDGYYCQTLNMGEHSGAHVDSPSHIIPSMMNHTIDTYPVNILLGPAIKYDLSPLGAAPGDRITKQQILELEKTMNDAACEGDIVLLHFGWQQYWTKDKNWKYYAKNAPGLSEDAVAMFADRKVKAVGSDTIACDTPVLDGVEYKSYGHQVYWLPNEIFIIEMLQNLDKIPQRSYFMALPLLIKNGSGSPIRPIVIY